MAVSSTRVLAAVAVALLSLAATGAATASTTTTPARDSSTILVKWAHIAPSNIPAVGDLKTKVKIVRVPPGWSVDQTVTFYRRLPGIDFAEPNYVAGQNGLSAPNDPLYSQQWGLARIDALHGWDVYPGSHAAAGAPIGIVDTGVDGAHPDLAGQVVPGATCVTGLCAAGGANTDENGHGTVNAGAAAAAANNGRGVAGVAHGAPLIPIKVIGSNGTATYAAIAAGIIWAADNGARVINLSLGGTEPSETLCGAVQYALDHGAFVDAATGNFGVSDPVYPAACPGTVGVGATDPTDGVPAWSDTGSPSLFVSAPGVLIHSTYPGGRYAIATGTSVAAALVSGLASLLIGQAPWRTPADVRRILATTSDKPGTDYGADPFDTCSACTWSATRGYGRINVFRALSSSVPSPPPPPPDFSIASPATTSSVTAGVAAHYQLAVAPQNSFDGNVSLAVSGLPAGATCSFAPASVPASGSSTLTVSTAGGTPAGSYSLTVHGTSGSLAHMLALTLTVAAAGPAPPAVNFTLSALPGSRIVRQGASTTVTVKALGAQGPVGSVDLSIAGLPAGVTASFTSIGVGLWQLTLSASLTAPRFITKSATIKGQLGTTVKTASLAVTVM